MPSSTSTFLQRQGFLVESVKLQSPLPSTTCSLSTGASAASKAICTEGNESRNHTISRTLQFNPSTGATTGQSTKGTFRRRKGRAPDQPKSAKAAPPAGPLSPALIDFRVGHILRAVTHPNAHKLYVSTVAMGDPEGTEFTHVDEETGKVVRTVCSGLKGLVPLEQMQNRKIVVVANLKPVNMCGVTSAAMLLAATIAVEDCDDPHARYRDVDIVNPPEGAEVGDKVYFEGWEYGEGKGPEKRLNPKKKQWEAIQPGFFTGEDLSVVFDAGRTKVEGDAKGVLVVEGKGRCTVNSLKGATVR